MAGVTLHAKGLIQGSQTTKTLDDSHDGDNSTYLTL